MPLRLIIENSTPDDVASQAPNPSVDFIQAAIRAAKHSPFHTREKILVDVCEILGCSKQDLAFLFTGQTSPANFHFPEYRGESVMLEAAE